MFVYIVRRMIAAVALLLVVSAITFAIFFLLPRLAGGTVDSLATQYVGKNPSPESIAAVKQNLGLDQPLHQQFWEFLKGIFVGREFNFGPQPSQCHAPCLGYSFKDHVEVWPQMLERLPITASLAFGAAVVWLVTGVTTGVISALRPGSLFDRVAMGVALAGVSLPMFFTGVLSLALFVFNWPIFTNVYVDFSDDPAGWFQALVLPWCTLAFLYSALYARLTRAGMLETMNEDYIRTARAKGLRERVVVTRHGLRSALTPIITIFGMDFGLLLGGAIVTETVFSYHGVGEYAYQAIAVNDLPKILGVTLFAAFFIVFCNLVVDLVYAIIDPRVRLS
ncbi:MULTISPECIES: ABC transporter permease [unclassified Streptomyces]|uniref:ABC transporter permease n=1 Tax=unclassified Streptomyces TaxID=2593676 RepID=UPI00288474CE|nr:ABC transporter permease [Streptomyces sp. DSM 41633]WSP92581.1 ABC transporter permease [Streptomyces sp. NBC_01233]